MKWLARNPRFEPKRAECFRLSRTAILCIRCRLHCSTISAYRFINNGDICTISCLHDHSATAPVLELRPMTLRPGLAYRALRVSDSSLLAGSGFPSKNFFHVAAPTAAYRTFPCLYKSVGRCPHWYQFLQKQDAFMVSLIRGFVNSCPHFSV
jgi:hypothetical protein